MYDRLSARCFMPYPEVPVPHAKEGPLTGLTFAVKDIFDVAGYPTSAGNPTFLALQGIKQKTASCVEKLLAAGAEFQGKTITDELAFSMQGANFHFGAPINGGAPDRYTGGSSSGSASACRLCVGVGYRWFNPLSGQSMRGHRPSPYRWACRIGSLPAAEQIL